jgi:predicted SAM-dependent methyltransferase
MKLNIGSGYKRYPGFLNVDHDPLVNPDFLTDLENLKLDIPDSSVEYVMAHHVLEHIGPGFFDLMKELYRVCKDGAILDIKVPHHRSDVYFMDPSHVRPITIDTMQLFSKTYNQWHIDNFNSSSGFGLKLDVDFELVDYKFNPYPKWEERFKSMTNEEIEEAVMDYNNVFHETMIIMKVKKHE